MGRYKKRYILMAGAAGFLLILLLCLNYLASTLINLESVKENIQASVSRKTGGSIAFTSIELSILPYPHAVIHQADISVPGKGTGTVKALNVYPKIWPLLTGKLQFDEIRIISPHIKVNLPGDLKERDEPGEPVTPGRVRDVMFAVLSSLAAEAPGLLISVEEGELRLDREGEAVFSFQDIDAGIDLPPEEFKITMRCTSDIWRAIEINARFDHKDLGGRGEIHLKGFQPQQLTAYLLPETVEIIGEQPVNLDLEFTADRGRIVSAEARGALPLLTMMRGDQKVTFKGGDLRGRYREDHDRTVVTLEKLELDYPGLSLTGELSIDNTSQTAGLTLEGRDVGVSGTREAALALAGDNSTVRDIFEVVRGGTVPVITFQSRGASFDDLDDLDNIVIKGRMQKGNIFVPGPDLDLHDAEGDVVISKGVLKGEHLSARLENAAGRSGTLTLGLAGDDAPFRLDMNVKADLTQLPPLLKRLVKDKDFSDEVSLMHNMQGRAEGRLIIGDRLQSLKVQVDISEIDFSVDYERIPYPLKIRGGQLSYDEASVSVKNLQGKIGTSSFSDLTARLSLARDGKLRVHSGRALLFMDEVYSWIASFEGPGAGPKPKELRTVKGTLDITSLTLEGPLLKPAEWNFDAKGEVKSLAAETTLFPDPVTVTGGKFTINKEKLSLIYNQVKVLDASLKVSGVIDRYLEGLQMSDMTFSGEMNEKAVKWVSDVIHLPAELSIRPLFISQARLNWERDSMTALKGDLAVKKGPAVTVDVLLNSKGLMINKLHIKDDESRALISLSLKDDEFMFNFDGNLAQATRDRIFSNLPYQGWIKGDFAVHVLTDRPGRSTVRGSLKGKGIVVPWKQKAPLTIDSILLNAEDNRINAETMLVWGEEPVVLKGQFGEDGKGFFFDMNMFVEKFHWDTIRDSLDKKEEDKKEEYLWEAPVRGALRVNADHFTFDTFTFSPLQADISFDRKVIGAEISKAELCGISVPGSIKVTARELSLDFQPAAENKAVEPAYACLFNVKKYMTGRYDLKADIKSEGRREEIVKSLKGTMDINAANGRIYQYSLLAKIFAFINITEVFRGQMPDMVREGFAYNTITARTNIRGSRLILKEVVIDAASMGIVSQGSIDFIDKQVDLKVLVSPLKTVDFIIKKIPVISDILGGTLVTIPVRVKGNIDNPQISYLSPADIGSGLLGIMKNVLKAPVKIIRPDDK